ncbi:MAG: ISL3 family transposase [Pyrinomonadaceae bacterium]|nr:ISL3 family transposase [Pyrinomonadaceae bacterium]
MLLDFGDESVVKTVETDFELNEVDIFVEYFSTKSSLKVYDYAPMRRWRHLDTMQFQTFINCRLPRIERANGRIETVKPSWADKHNRHSYLFESAVISLLMATQNQSRAAQLMRCLFDLMNRIMHGATRRGMERWKESKEVIEHLSLDEKAFQKGHHYASVLSEPMSGKVLEVVEHRTTEACRTLLNNALSEEERSQVKTLSIDMWEAFLSVGKEKLPNAKIVHDRFHLIKYLNEAIDQVRRREVKEHAELKDSRYALLKNEEHLTTKQRLKFEAIRAANFEVGKAWQARENFKKSCGNRRAEEAEMIFAEWRPAVKESGVKEVIKVAEMFANHLSGVINAMTTRFNNAMAERLNGKIQLLKAIGRGYRKFANFRSAILFFYGKLDLFPLNSR